ncbi:MAG: hypothetical protein MN733_12670 [Nitrososphaera sp.]|nr:hypothetical protein [Nitrososphaera sp.]
MPAYKNPADVILGLPVAHEDDEWQRLSSGSEDRLIIFSEVYRVIAYVALDRIRLTQNVESFNEREVGRGESKGDIRWGYNVWID